MTEGSRERLNSPKGSRKGQTEKRGTKGCLATLREIRCRDLFAVVAKKMLVS